jgi:sigma-B regulation protein RsbU (phosphoserine phosphatase)
LAHVRFDIIGHALMTERKLTVQPTPNEPIMLASLEQINADLRLDSAIKNVLTAIIDLFDCEAGNVILLDLRTNALNSYSFDSEHRVKNLKFSEELIGWRSANRSPVIANNPGDEEQIAALESYLDVKLKNIISVPLFTEGEFFGLIQAINSRGPDGFSVAQLESLRLFGEHVALTLRNSWLLEDAIRGSREARSLYEVGVALSATLELDELLEKILDNLQRVVTYDSAMIYLVSPQGGIIHDIVSRGIPESMRGSLPMKMGQGVTGRVAQTGQGIIVSDVSENPDYIACRIETRSELAVPLKAGDNIIGAFNIESDKPHAYTQHDLELLNAFASLAAISIERGRLYNERMASRKLSLELSIARRIQMTFLPSQDPTIDGFDISGVNIASADVGGDYYDFIPIVDNQLGVAIGDVVGKGVPASLIMAAFRASLKAEIRNNFAIRAILQKVNNLLYESIERDKYVTAVYSVLDSKNRVLTFSNAGHNPPILRRANGSVEYLSEGGLALGTFPDSKYEERPISLSPGDILLFYTDGVTEVLDCDGKEFGVKRLLAALEESKGLSAKEIVEFVVNSTNNFARCQQDTDDLTMIVIKTL